MKAYEIDREIASVDKQITLLSYLKPLNLTPEKILFLEGKRQNPVFTYKPLDFDARQLVDRLNALKPDSTPLGILFQKKIDEIFRKIALLISRGSKAFETCSHALYGMPSKGLEDSAYRILKNPHPISKRGEKFNTEQIRKIFEAILHGYGLKKWHVHIKENLVSDVAAGKRHSLFLRDGISFTRLRLDRIISHEIETHILTAENGKYQPYKLFQIGFANYLETQEGLAIYAQECHEQCIPFSAHRVSYLTISVVEASRGSFRDVFQKMKSFGLSDEKAFRMALRAKRGFGDTGANGAFTKDLLYLKGYIRIADFKKNGGDLKKLLIGKVALEDLPFIENIPGIVPPKFLPKWLG